MTTQLKLKVGHFYCLLKTLNYNIAQNFGHVQNKSITYRPGIYNLQTRTLTFKPSNKTLPNFKTCDNIETRLKS